MTLNMKLKTNQNGIDIIKHFEGLRTVAYKCPAGRWTIGYGHTGLVGDMPVHAGMIITEAKAESLLRSDLKWCEDAVNGLIEKYYEETGAIPTPPGLLDSFAALVSLTYNVGAGWTRNSGLRTLLLSSRWLDAADRILAYNKANGRVLKGLKLRREAERKLFIGEDWR